MRIANKIRINIKMFSFVWASAGYLLALSLFYFLWRGIWAGLNAGEGVPDWGKVGTGAEWSRIPGGGSRAVGVQEKAKKIAVQLQESKPRYKKKVGFFCAIFCGACIYNPNTPCI